MEPERLEKQIRFILEADRLKEVFRQTQCIQSRRAENDAEHSWHLCLCVIVLAEHADARGLDILRVLKMLLIHDLVEIDAGDTFAYDAAGRATAHEREAKAADRIFGMLPGDQAAEYRALWDEFEAMASPESVFAAAIDRFQPCLLNTATEGASWKRHNISKDRVYARNSAIGKGSAVLWEALRERIDATARAGHIAEGPAPS